MRENRTRASSASSLVALLSARVSVFPATLVSPSRAVPTVLRGAVVGVLGLAVAAALAVELTKKPPSLALAIGGSLGGLMVLLLALARYDWAVGLGVVLLFYVKKDPAPSDAVFLIAIAVGIATGRFVASRVPTFVSASIGIYLTLNVIALAGVANMARAFRFSFTTFYLALFGLWLASWVTSRARAALVCRTYVFATVLSAALGTFAYAGGPGRATLLEYGGTRAVALYKDPNVFGAFLVPAALIVVDELLAPKILKGRRLTKIAMFLVLTLGVVVSFSRAAWINLALGILAMIAVFALRRGGTRRAAALLTSMLITVGVIGVVLAATGSLGFLQSRAQVQAYDTQRFGAQADGLRIVSQHPLGVGPGQFEHYAPLSAHSTYVRALAELGVLGFVCALALLLGTLVLAARNAALGRETYGIGSAPLLGAWSGLLLSGFVIDTLHWRHLWLIAALIWSGSMRRVRPAAIKPAAIN
jgi:O-antigen ligase